MLTDLKKFLFKDDLIDIAVAFILAAAFGLVIKALVNSVLMPIIAAIVGKPSFDDIVIHIGSADIGVGVFITALVNFVIVGTVLFFIVEAIRRTMRNQPADPETSTPSAEAVLLGEIRDSLVAGRR